MTWRSGSLALAIALLATAVLVPIAQADHTYSHRYIVFGRVVDSENNPVSGVTVNLGYKDFQPDGPCVNQPNTETEAWGPTRTLPVTNQFGEFIFCFHTHAMSRALPGTGILTVEGTQTTEEFKLDPYTRHTFQVLRLPEPHPDADGSVLEQQYTVHGTIWRDADGETYLDGVRVFGLTIDDTLVNVTFEYNDQEPVTVQAKTNGYGDFAIRIPVTERPTSGKVTVEVDNQTFEEDVTELGVTSMDIRLDAKKDPFLGKFLLGLGIFAGVVVVGGAAWYGGRKYMANREEAIARERSTRKRANK